MFLCKFIVIKHVEFGLFDTSKLDIDLNLIIWQSRQQCSVCVCVSAEREFHQRELSRDQTWSLAEKKKGGLLHYGKQVHLL